MMHLLVIAAFVGLYLRDGMRAPILREYIADWSPVWIAAWSVGSLLLLWGAAHAATWRLGRRIDATGSYRAIRRADMVLTSSRISAVFLHLFNILGLGWLDVVRGVTGNLVALDELIACAPLLAVFILGWWSMYPIDRRMRDAVILSEFDNARAMPPILTRRQFVLNSLRHQLSWVLLPIACILAWGELADRAQARRWLPSGEGAKVLIQLTGLAVILIVMPLAMRRIWDTVVLGTGPLRDRLLAMCRTQRVKVSELLVWRTQGAMINGAVMGLIPRLRYILLTDALLEHLPPDQVEAVTAHEIGHVKRRHILWLIASGIGSLTIIGVGIQLLMEVARPGVSASVVGQSVGSVVSLAAAFVVFGFVSRRFEWQADAFAVQHMSGLEPGRTGVLVTPEAVGAMRGALESVARLNHIPRRRFTWRHGSIATRQLKLAQLVGMKADRLPIDRQARWIAAGAAGAALISAGLIAWASVSSPPPPRIEPKPWWEAGRAPAGMEVLGAIRQDAGNRERLHLP
jgi:STE24 endopeptidase